MEKKNIVIDGISFDIDEVKKMNKKDFVSFFSSIGFSHPNLSKIEKEEVFSSYYKTITGKDVIKEDKANESLI